MHSSQAQSCRISGQVLNAVDSSAIAFAHLKLSQGLGTLSSEMGRFQVSFKNPRPEDSLQFSHISFQTKSVPLAEICRRGNLKVFLNEADITLQTLPVLSISAYDLVRQAVEKIPENYENQHKQGIFYRLHTLSDERSIHLSEVLMDQYHGGYQKKKNLRKLDVLRVRSLVDERGSHGLELGMQPSGIAELDLLANVSDCPFLSKGEKEYEYEIEGQRKFQGREVLVISFDQKKDLRKAGYKGEIFIDQQSKAIHYIKYAISPRGLTYAKYGDAATRTMLAMLGLKIRIRSDENELYYQVFGDKWALQSANLQTHLDISSGIDKFDLPINAKVWMVVCELDTSLSRSDFQAFESKLGNQILESLDSEDSWNQNYWDSVNIIISEIDFEELAQQIINRNQEYELRDEIWKRQKGWPKDEVARIDSILSFYHKKGQFNGTALVDVKGKWTFQKNFAEENIPLSTRQSIFRIGSVSKTFTSFAILKLMDEGRLDLNDTLGKFFPDYAHPQLKIKQLLSHSSGLDNYTDKPDFYLNWEKEDWSLEDLMRDFMQDDLLFKPGNQFKYSNSGFVILALVIEKLSGQSYTEYIQQNILGPLGMTSTFIGNEILDQQRSIEGQVWGKTEKTYNLDLVLGAGGLASTVDDLLKWSYALDEGWLISEEYYKRMWKPWAEYRDWNSYYGLGWMINRGLFEVSERNPVNFHPGTDHAFYSMFLKQPSKGITIVLMSHCGEFPRMDISDLILQELN
jgi:CubicO group peptidase (beta-lactamase class C family)